MKTQNRRKIFLNSIALAVFAFSVWFAVPEPVLAVCVERGTGDYTQEGDGECPEGSFDPGVAGGLEGNQNTQITTVGGLINRVAQILNNLAPLIIGLAILVILWGIFQYISKAGEEEKRAEGRMFIIYGIVGVFIMVSIWGLVNILDNTFLLQKTTPTDYPGLPAIP